MFVKMSGTVINLDQCVKFYVSFDAVYFNMVDGKQELVRGVDNKMANSILSDILEALERGDNVISV